MLPQLGAGPRTPGQADAAQAAGFNESGKLQLTAADAKMDDEAAGAQRAALAAEQGVAEWDKTKAANDKVYEAYTQKADQETASWLKDMDETAKAEVQPGRYFENLDTFRQVMWVVALAAGAMGQALSTGAGADSNPVIDMLHARIDQDIASQKAVLQARMGVQKQRGESLDAKHARDLRHLGDDNAARWQRWSVVEKLAQTRAAMPGPEHRKAGYAQLAAEAANVKMGILDKRVTEAHTDARAAAERSIQWANHGEQVTARKADDARADRQQLIGVAQNEEERGDKYALATIKADAKTGADGEVDKDHRVLPAVTGFRVRGADNQETDLVVPKEQYEAVSKAAKLA